MILRQPHHRHGLRLRRRARLDHRARIGVTLADDAGEWRRDARVRRHRLDFLFIRGGDLHTLLGRRQGFFGSTDLRFRHTVARHGVVNFLLRHQIGTLLDHFRQPRVGKVRRLV